MAATFVTNFSKRELEENIVQAIGDDGISEVLDRILVMRKQEDTSYRCHNVYGSSMPSSSTFTENNVVDSLCRIQMCAWFYQVIDNCSLSRETVAIAMSYIDRFMCTEAGRKVFNSRKDYRLTTMTALYMAIKLHEPAMISIEVLVSLTRGTFVAQDFVRMEGLILSALNWRVNGPTTLAFVRCYLALLPSDAVDPSLLRDIESLARYQTEIVAVESTFIDYRPSEIALAAIANSISEIGSNILPLSVSQYICYDIAQHAGLTFDYKIIEIQTHLTLLMTGVSPSLDVDCKSNSQKHATGLSAASSSKISVQQSDLSPVRVAVSDLL